jgi:hypothetical protein
MLFSHLHLGLLSGFLLSGFPTGGMTNRPTYIILIGKTEGKRTLGRHKHRWEGSSNTEINIK